MALAPADPTLSSHRYNPFYYISKDPNLRIRDLQLVAEIIIPAERVDGGFWYTSSRDLFLMLALYLFETKGMATLAEIHDLSKQEDFVDWLEQLLEEEAVEDPVFIQNAHSFLTADNEKTRKSILKDFHSRMSLFMDPMVRYATSGNDFNLSMLRKQKMSVYIQIPDADKMRLRPILTLFWAQAINHLSQSEPDLKQEPFPVLALLDEFGNMARIDKLREGLTFLRSYRVRAIVIVQYLGQIVANYGHENAKAFLNCKVKIAFALNDINDARFISESLGHKTIKVRSHSSSQGQHTSTSQSTNYQPKALMMPDEIMTMKSSRCLVLLESYAPVLAKKMYWFKHKQFRHLIQFNQKNRGE